MELAQGSGRRQPNAGHHDKEPIRDGEMGKRKADCCLYSGEGRIRRRDDRDR